MGKPGPKRSDVPREPGGRKSRRKDFRDIEAEENRRVAVEARQRVLGVSAEHARDQKAATVIGRWRLDNIISEAQYEAAEQYLFDATAYSVARNSPLQPGAVVIDAVHGSAGDDDAAREAWCIKAVEKYEAALQVVMEADLIHLNCKIAEAIACVVLKDLNDRHRVGDLRLGLNALAHHYRIVERKSA